MAMGTVTVMEMVMPIVYDVGRTKVNAMET